MLAPLLYVVMLWGCPLKANCAGSLFHLIEFCWDALKQIVLAPIFTCLRFDGQAQKSKLCWPPFFVFVFHATHILSADVVVITCYAFLLSKHGINGFISCAVCCQ